MWLDLNSIADVIKMYKHCVDFVSVELSPSHTDDLLNYCDSVN